MSRDSLVDRVRKLVDVLQPTDENWEDRVKALRTLQDWTSTHADSGEMCSMDVLRQLDDALIKQVRDLRSAVVKEACITVGHMAQMLGDGFRPLAYMLLPAMIEVTASGNKVIASHVHEAVKTVLSNCHAKNAVAIVTEGVRNKSNAVREGCFEYLKTILEFFHPAKLDTHAKALLEAVRIGMEDPSAKARTTARQCYPYLLTHFPIPTEKMFQRLDARTQKLLEKEGLTVPAVIDPSAITNVRSPSDGASATSGGHYFAADDIHSVSSRGSAPVKPPTQPLAVNASKTPVKPPVSAPVTPSTSAVAPLPKSAQKLPSARKISDPSMDTASWLQLYMRVVVMRGGRKPGTIRFIGETEFGPGTWVGVELDAPQGNNSGTIDGVTYFSCAPNRGIFVKPANLLPELGATDADAVDRESLSSARSTVTPAEAKNLFTFEEARDMVPVAPKPVVEAAPSPPRDVVQKAVTPPAKPTSRNIDSEDFLACHRQYIDEVLDSIRQEMLLLSKFESVSDTDAATGLQEYIFQVKAAAGHRAALAQSLLGQFGFE